LIIKFIEHIGDKVINFISSLYSFFSFSIFYTIQIFNYHNYSAQTFRTLIYQIYYTSVATVPFFIIIAFIFGSIILGALIVFATNFGMEVQIASIIVSFIVNDFAPLFTAIFIFLRSRTLIHKKLAHIDIKNKTNLIHNIILPRIISGIFSVVSLSLIFAIIMIASGYIFTLFFMGMDLHTYKYLIIDAIEFSNITSLMTKSMVFGFVITVIAIQSGLKVVKNDITLIELI